jgi:hypothetical protein
MNTGTCQFCEKVNGQTGRNQPASLRYEGKLKYGVRHYAHFECFLVNKGVLAFRELPGWKMAQFPYRLLKEWGLLDVAVAKAPLEFTGEMPS